MNKFAPIAFTLLLSCGVALWFLASDSLNFHIKSQLQTLGSELSQQSVRVENVTIHAYQSSGTISNLTINHSVTANASTTKPVILSIASIDLVINRKSLKKEVIIVDSLIIQGLTASYTRTAAGTSLKQLLSVVQGNVEKLISKKHKVNSNDQQLQQHKITSPLLKVTKVIVKPGVLYEINAENKRIASQVLPQIEWENNDTNTGLSGEEIAIAIFERLLSELAVHSEKAPQI